MTRLTDDALRVLLRDFVDRLSGDAPEWTSRRDDDPGITLLELCEFLTEQLNYRDQPLREDGSKLVSRIVESLERLRRPPCGAFSGVRRVRYFDGQVLTADDLLEEQTYHRTRRRLHNRCLHGSGIATGLDVTLGPNSTAGEPEVRISPGSAITPVGEELVLWEVRVCRLSACGASGVVALRFVERGVLPTPTPAQGGVEFSRIEEGVAVEFASGEPQDAVAIARLDFVNGAWRVDPGFQPAHAH